MLEARETGAIAGSAVGAPLVGGHVCNEAYLQSKRLLKEDIGTLSRYARRKHRALSFILGSFASFRDSGLGSFIWHVVSAMFQATTDNLV